MRARFTNVLRLALGLSLLLGAIGPVALGSVPIAAARPLYDYSLGGSTSGQITTGWPSNTPFYIDVPTYELAGVIVTISGADGQIRKSPALPSDNNAWMGHNTNFGGNGTFCFERGGVHDGACAAVGYTNTDGGGWGGADFSDATIAFGLTRGSGSANANATLTAILAGAPTPTPAPTSTPTGVGTLISYWPLDEASGTRLDALTSCGGGGCDLADNNTVTSASGKISNAASFALASSEYLSKTDHADLSTGNINFTVAGWVNLTTKPGFMGLLSKGTGGGNADNEYQLYYSSSSDRFIFTVGNGTSSAGATANNLGSPSTGTWYYIVAWHDAAADTVNIQVNNGTVNSVSWTGGGYDNAGALLMGKLNTGSYLNGLMDEWGFWKRVLTTDERTCLYNSGNGTTYPFASCNPTPTPSPAPSGEVNLLRDGDIELLQPAIFQMWEFSPDNPRDAGFGRVRHSTIMPPPFLADCGTTYQGFGGDQQGGRWLYPLNMVQRFTWPGGPIYLSYDAHGDPQAPGGVSHLSLELVSVVTGTHYEYDDSAPYSSYEWTTRTWLPITLPAGDYILNAGLGAGSYATNQPDGRYRTVFIDNIWIGTTLGEACSLTNPVPTATRTPTPTRTPTGILPSPTPGPTLTPAPTVFNNCGFESGSAGWTGEFIRIELAGGPSGPQWAHLTAGGGRIGRNFSWNLDGYAYFEFWVGPQSWGELHVRNQTTGATTIIWSGSNTSANWLRFLRVRYLPAATYRMEFEAHVRPLGTPSLKIDGATVSRNGYVSCSGGTPTPGATSFVSPTPTRTATTGPSPTASSSAVPSATPTPNPTSTPQPTYTPRPTSTYTGPELTATAQGTVVPTHTPGGPGGEGCDVDPLDCPVPEQPEPAPNAECLRPQYFWQVAQWIDYTRCEILKYFAWSQDNTQQLVDIGEQIELREPFGTMSELLESVEAVQFVIDQYAWTETGYTGVFEEQRPSLVETGQLFLSGSAYSFTGNPLIVAAIELEIDYCESQLITIFSTNVVGGVCVVWAWSRYWGITAWSQFFFDLAAWVALIRFVVKGFLS